MAREKPVELQGGREYVGRDGNSDAGGTEHIILPCVFQFSIQATLPEPEWKKEKTPRKVIPVASHNDGMPCRICHRESNLYPSESYTRSRWKDIASHGKSLVKHNASRWKSRMGSAMHPMGLFIRPSTSR